MKNSILIMSVLLLTAFSNKTKTKHNHSNLKIDTKISRVEWIGKKVTGQHNGTISIKEGVLNLHDGHLSGGKVSIDMKSITCTDIEDEGYNKKLVGHLNSADFFDVANHNLATLVITNVKQTEENKHLIAGNLTIKGITKPISFPATISMKDGKLGAVAEMKIDRTLYAIKYGSGKFFEGLGDKMIADDFVIKFKIAAT